jgi:feruloyl-CoA synthase
MVGLTMDTDNIEAFQNEAVIDFLNQWQQQFSKNSTGSSTNIKKYMIALNPPSIDLGEITDKGSLNQRAVLKYRKELVNEIYNLENANSK